MLHTGLYPNLNKKCFQTSIDFILPLIVNRRDITPLAGQNIHIFHIKRAVQILVNLYQCTVLFKLNSFEHSLNLQLSQS